MMTKYLVFNMVKINIFDVTILISSPERRDLLTVCCAHIVHFTYAVYILKPNTNYILLRNLENIFID